MDDKLKNFLRKRLNEKLPGLNAQKIMAPVSDNEDFRPFVPRDDAKRSAVLLLLCRVDDELKVLLTLRSDKLNSHRGQISFPGGRKENGERPVETALRETFEEVGIAPDKIEILGRLSDLYIPPSNSIVSPVVGYIGNTGELKINPSEVEEAFYIDIDFLANPGNRKTETWDFDGIKADIPLWDAGKKVPIWGATAMMLSEFFTIYKEFEEVGILK